MKIVLFIFIISLSALAQLKNNTILIQTTVGDIKIQLHEETPITAENFKTYLNEGFYNGKIFHRVVSNFVVQAGGFNAPMVYTPATHPEIINEAQFAKSNLRGTIAMARRKEPNTARAQFYFNLVDNTNLDWDGENNKFGFCVFGEIIEGIEVMDYIGEVPTGNRTFTYNGQEYTFKDVPKYPILILSTKIEE